MITLLFTLLSLAHAETGTWLHCESSNKEIIFENGHVTLEGKWYFQNITDMKPLFEEYSVFKGKKPQKFTIIFLPAQERFSESPIGTLKDYFEDPIMNRFALHFDFLDFEKVSVEEEDKDHSDGERDCRIKTKTTKFNTNAELHRQNETMRALLKCIRTDQERFGGCS